MHDSLRAVLLPSHGIVVASLADDEHVCFETSQADLTALQRLPLGIIHHGTGGDGLAGGAGSALSIDLETGNALAVTSSGLDLKGTIDGNRT